MVSQLELGCQIMHAYLWPMSKVGLLDGSPASHEALASRFAH